MSLVISPGEGGSGALLVDIKLHAATQIDIPVSRKGYHLSNVTQHQSRSS